MSKYRLQLFLYDFFHFFKTETGNIILTAKRIVWGSKFDIDYGYIRISVNAYQRLAKELYNIFDKEKC